MQYKTTLNAKYCFVYSYVIRVSINLTIGCFDCDIFYVNPITVKYYDIERLDNFLIVDTFHYTHLLLLTIVARFIDFLNNHFYV